MKQKSKDRRVINIRKEDYEIIKNYCVKNTLNMPKWVSKVVIEKINEGGF